MKKYRLIPFLLFRNGYIVQSRRFKHHKIISKATTTLSRFSSWDADELCLVNISTDSSYHSEFIDITNALSKVCKMPLCVGGGIHSVRQGLDLINAGADKLYINSACFSEPSVLIDLSNILGSQAITASVQYVVEQDKRYIRNKDNTFFDLDFCDYIRLVESFGSGEISLLCESNDGLSCGYDIDGISLALKATSLPVIPFGGGRTKEQFIEAYRLPGLEALSAGNVFHFKEQSYLHLNKALRDHGIILRQLTVTNR